jgi:DNA mismatch repair protein MutS
MFLQVNFNGARQCRYIDKLLQILIQVRFWFKKIRMIFGNFGEDTIVFYLEDWIYKEDYIWNLNEAFSNNFLKGFGIEELKEGIIASGAILYYCPKHNIIKYNI